MAKQSLKWTVLPNGVRNGKAQVSLFLTPRLVAMGDSTLAEFPDFADWPAKVAAATFRLRFGTAAPAVATRVSPDPDPLSSALWKAIMRPGTFVKSSGPSIWAATGLRSFSVRDVLAGIEEIRASVALESPTEPPLPQFEEAPQILSRGRRPLAAATDRKRLGAALGLRAKLRNLSVVQAPLVSAGQEVASPTARRVALRAADADAERVTREFANARDFHCQAELAAPRLSMQQMQTLLKLIDFHEIVGTLGQYPRLLRRLGLVIDLEVPLPFQATNAVCAEVEWSPTTETETATPWTAYAAGGAFFRPRVRDANGGDIIDGMLRLEDPDRFDVVQIDVDSAAMQAMQKAGEVSETPVPTVRSAGLAVARVDRAPKMASLLARQLSLETLVPLYPMGQAPPGAPPAPNAKELLHAEDLVRGYRLDVRDEETGTWFSLCRRIGSYSVVGGSDALELEDEGWASSAVTKSGGPDATEANVHEVLFRWEGWSLCAPRPGKPLQAEGAPEGTARFGLDVRFRPVEKSLPRLRYGKSYRMRARAVDLAGNSPPADLASDEHASEAEVYLRHEPIGAPVLAPRESLLPKPGESLERLVIRSYNAEPAKDTVVTAEAAERHVAPPQVSQQMAETHGMFDGPQGIRGDAATYQSIIENDGTLPEVAAAEQLALPYLPDPLAWGAAIRYLPPQNPAPPPAPLAAGSRSAAQLRFEPATKMRTRIRAPYLEEEARLLHIQFDGAWPDVRPFRIRIFEPADGADEPWFEDAKRIFHVPLEKGEVAEMWLSCCPEPKTPVAHGVWRTITEGAARPALVRGNKSASALRPLTVQLSKPDAIPQWSAQVGLQPQEVELLGDLAIQLQAGIHWMMTPFRKLVLVHATQQPLRAPDLVEAKLHAIRALGWTRALIDHETPIAISGMTTAKVAVRAEWTDYFDQGTGDEQPMRTVAKAVLPDRMVEADDTTFSLSSRNTAQEFGDTKHRKVTYTAVATTRFREYFDVTKVDAGQLVVTREGAPATIHVPSSARPAAPVLHSVLPAFGWQRLGMGAPPPAPPSSAAPSASATVAPKAGPLVTGDMRERKVTRRVSEKQVVTATIPVISERSGGGVRVYLERPWFSTGEDELLGVVLAQPSSGRPVREGATGAVRVAGHAPITQWGQDPLWVGAPVKGLPTPDQFPLATHTQSGLSTAEAPDGALVAVAGHPVAYDPLRRLWYADVQLDAGDAYWPFVRFALARYQPYSIEGCHLSSITLADFVQLPPPRRATVSYAQAATQITVEVSGPTYNQKGATSLMEASVEQASAASGGLGWIPALDEPVTLENRGSGVAGVWRSTVTLPGPRTERQYRLVLREYEYFLADGAPETQPLATMVATPPDTHVEPRLVYADVLVLPM